MTASDAAHSASALVGRCEPTHVAYLSTYPPRECGIATFCEDLLTSTLLSTGAAEPIVLAVENGGAARRYAWPVAMVVDEHVGAEYEAAAGLVNDSLAHLVSVQHEFGIYGGVAGEGLFRFLRLLRKPAVTTLHTVLPDPDSAMRSSIARIAECSERLVVMNELATDILVRDYGVDRAQVSLIHHGALPPSLESREEAKARLGLSGRTVLSTFGLVARGKGIQYAIGALPTILRRHPDACYAIVGQTHPGVQRVEQESYREELERRVRELGVQEAVRFVNRYIPKTEIVRYLAATDIYITPYLNPHQITSGTLAYALAAGTVVVSTPYLYARFLLGDRRGILVAFRSEQAIGEAVNRVLDDSELRSALERRARAYGQRMYWPAVGAQHLRLFQQVRRELAPTAERTAEHLQLALPGPSTWEERRDLERHRPTTAPRPLAAAD